MQVKSTDKITRWHIYQAIKWQSTGRHYQSGVTAARRDKLISCNPEEPFHDAFYKLGAYLTAVGLTYDDILEMTIF